MLHRHLRQATARAHARVESRLGIMRADLTLSAYRQLLTAFYRIYQPLEPLIANASGGEFCGNLPGRQRTAYLLQDLAALGMAAQEISAITDTPHLPPLPTRAHALGAMYVTEGATLGGQFIARHVRAQVGLSPETGLAFFTGGGIEPSHVTADWQRFRDFLDAQDASTVNAVTAGALDTFDCFEQTFAEI